jgi:hypothetical protein
LKNIPAKNSVIVIAMVIVFTGCGFKGNPAPYPALPDRKPVTKNMEAFSTREAVVLKWNFQDKDGLISYIGVEKSEFGTPGNECKNCPRTFTRIGQIAVKAGMPADKEQRALTFTDTDVVREKIYSYRLMLCEENGNCSEASTVEINFK